MSNNVLKILLTFFNLILILLNINIRKFLLFFKFKLKNNTYYKVMNEYYRHILNINKKDFYINRVLIQVTRDIWYMV